MCIVQTATASATASATATATHPSMKESTQGGRPPPCVEAARSAASFMDGCVAVAVAEAEAVAVAVAEAVAVAVAVLSLSAQLTSSLSTPKLFQKLVFRARLSPKSPKNITRERRPGPK